MSVHVVTGGDLVFAFGDKQLAGMQAIVMIGANLDVEMYEIPADRWPKVRAAVVAMAAELGLELLENIDGRWAS